MITLHIKEKGHLIEIPGMNSFRTPATIDVSNRDIRTIVGYLKVCDINDYEIIASNKSGSESYTAKDFNATPSQRRAVPKKKKEKNPDKALEKRMNRMEKMIEKLHEKSSGDLSKKEEQTTNQMEQFQKTMLDAIKNISVGKRSEANEKKTKDSIDDDPAPFIPDIDTKGMKIKSQGDHKSVKKEKGSDDLADALSKLLNK